MTSKKILVIKWGAIGDLIATTPAIQLIRKHYPNAHIVYLTNALSKQITPSGSIVDEIWVRAEAKNLFALLKRIRKSKFDLVFNLKWGSESADILALLSKAKIKVGGSKKKYLRSFYDYKPPFLKDDCNRHEYLKNTDIVNSLKDHGGDVNAYMHVTPEDSAFAKTLLNKLNIHQKQFIVISPAASTLKKAWAKEKYIALSKFILTEYDYDIMMTYAPEDKDYAEEIVKAVGGRCYLSPKTSLNQVAALVGLSKLCVCNNSGIMHIAFAMNVPTMCFNTSIGWHPFGENDICVNRIPKDVIDNRSLTNDQVANLMTTIPLDEAIARLREHEHSA